MAELLPYVREILASTAERWQALAATVEPELLERAPAPGEWSALECLQHLVDTEEAAFPVRVRRFLAGEDLTNFDPDAAGSKPVARDPSATADRFAALRVASLELYDTLGPPDLDRTAIHSELGRVTLREMLHEWAAHDLMHTVQAERALMQPLVVQTGPWRPFFAAHDVERS